MIGVVDSIPVLAASAPMSPSTASSWRATNSGARLATPCTPIEFCAVTAVRTEAPNTRKALKVFRSAWMPAPPPESEPAMVSARGIAGLVLIGGGSTHQRTTGSFRRLLGDRRASDVDHQRHLAAEPGGGESGQQLGGGPAAKFFELLRQLAGHPHLDRAEDLGDRLQGGRHPVGA